MRATLYRPKEKCLTDRMTRLLVLRFVRMCITTYQVP